MKFSASTLLLFIGLSFYASASEPLPEVASNRIPAWQWMQIIEDPDGTLTPEELSDWQPLSNGVNLGQTNSHYWFLLEEGFRNDQESWYFYLSNSAIDHIELYAFADGKWRLQHSVGDHQPFNQRPIQSLSFILPLAPTASSYLIHIWGNTPLFLPMELANTAGLVETINHEQIVGFTMVGVIVAMIFFNLFLWLGTRIQVYGWYVFYISGAFLFSSFVNGSAFRYLWPENIWLQNHSGYLIIGLFYFAALSFADRFLDLRNSLPKLHRWISPLRFVPLLTIPAAFISPYLAFKIGTLGTLLMVALIPLSGILAWRQKVLAAHLFTLSWLVMLVGIFTLNLTLSGTLPASFIGHRAMDIGVACESVLLSFALAARIREIQRQSKLKDQQAQEQLLAAYHDVDTALEKARISNQAKDSFLRVAGHELKTPVHTLMGHLQLLDNHPSNNRAIPERLKDIEISAQRLSERIENLITYSEINAQALKPFIQTVNIREECQQVVNLWQSLVTDQQLTISLSFNDDLPSSLELDWLHTRKIFTAALDHALSVSTQGEIQITVGMENEQLMIRISDRGPEIDPATQMWITGQQPDANLDQVGLGLFICKSLIVALDGEMTLETSPSGHGLFTLRLPVRIVENVVTQQKKASSAQVQASVLVVDDNQVNLQLLCAMLDRLGHRATGIDNGLKAIEQVKQQPFDLILMDCQMPGIDGYEATKKILSEKKIPIVAVTANSTDEERQKCIDSGMKDFIAKPVRLATLETCLSNLLAGNNA